MRPESKSDFWIRLIGGPVIGLAIPNLTGLYAGLGPTTVWYWIGSLWFILVSLLVWQGNLWLWLRWRAEPGWLDRPLRRTWLLVASSLFYTVPVSTAMLWAWYLVIAIPPDWTVIAKSTLACVFADLFIKNTYESVYLIRQRHKLERAKLQAELSALKGQVDPHFVLNCLNSFTALTSGVAERATDFAVAMANLYRFMLRMRDRDLVPLEEELAFTRQYQELLALRFECGIELSIRPRETPHGAMIPPAAIQMLLENAVKHNRFSAADPLKVLVEIGEDSVRVSNDARPGSSPATGSTGLGLRNLTERCQLLLNRPIQVSGSQGRFSVVVPFRPAAQLISRAHTIK